MSAPKPLAVALHRLAKGTNGSRPEKSTGGSTPQPDRPAAARKVRRQGRDLCEQPAELPEHWQMIGDRGCRIVSAPEKAGFTSLYRACCRQCVPCLCKRRPRLSGQDAPDWMKRQLEARIAWPKLLRKLSDALHRVAAATSPPAETIDPVSAIAEPLRCFDCA